MRHGISVAEAQTLVLQLVKPLPAETVASAEALGRVLAEPLRARRALPPADCSAMDGYAVRTQDLRGASAHAPVELRVAYEVAAGGAGTRPLEPGEAARIFTGAPVPAGADAVVRQEDVEAAGDRVRIGLEPAGGQEIRLAGEDVRVGDTVLEAGCVLGPAHLGMLASLGRTFVRVHQRPRVAVLSGGDELVDPDGDVAGGRIVASNAYSLAAQVRAAGGTPFNLGIARDTPEDLERLLSAGLEAHVLVSSAGVSVGDHDHVRPVLERLGCELVFWGVQMKPGYPIAFGHFRSSRGPLVFGLPGNPVSAMVTFEQFVRPALRQLSGHGAPFRPLVRVTLSETLTKKPGRLHFVRVTLTREGDRVLASSTGSQSSGVLRSMTRAQGLLLFPADSSVLAAGESAVVQVFEPEFFSSSESGA